MNKQIPKNLIFGFDLKESSFSLLPMISTIVTHPGGAHKDEFLACAVLLSKHPVPVFRREPDAEDLSNPAVVVLDVGGRHEPESKNFDHHQFPRDHPPTCSLSLVLQDLEIYEDAKEFFHWLEPAEWFDCRGPNETAEWLGVDRETMGKLNSPLDVTLLKSFASSTEHRPGEPVWEVMKMIGTDLIDYLFNLRARIDAVAEIAEVWELGQEKDSFTVLFAPRTDPTVEDASSGLGWRVRELGLEEKVVALVYPDGRGEGYGMRRYEDSPVLDFSRLADEPEVHFAHNRGFIAKTNCTDPGRLKQMLLLAKV